MVDYAKIGNVNLTAREVLSRSALDKRLDELEKQERRGRKGLTMKIEELRKKLEVAKEWIAMLEGAVREDKTSPSTKRETAK